MTDPAANSPGSATLRNRAAGIARITLVPTMADLTLSAEQLAILHLYDIIADLGARLSQAEAQLAAAASVPALVFTSRRRSVVLDFISRRRIA